MYRNYLLTAWRNLTKNKIFSFINIFGLAIGLACCIVASLYITDELSYDKHHRDSDRIYRVVKDFVNDDGSKLPDATTPPAISAAIQKDIPEIEKTVRLFPGWGGKFYVRRGEKRFIEENLYRADSSIFEVFTFTFIHGDPKTALKNPNAVVLTESSAKKYFGNENPIGKTLDINTWPPREVTAVIKDLSNNSHFDLDLLVPLRFTDNNNQPIDINSQWEWYNFYTYIKIKPHANIAAVDKKIREVFKRNQPENENHFYTQALTDIHLTSNLKWELKPNSDKKYIYVFGTVAVFLLLIACINYVNLTTARSSLRAKEIGVRKVSGANKRSLVFQFLSESILTSVLGAVMAILIAQVFLPSINNITQKDLSLFTADHLDTLSYVVLIAIVIGLIAGLYPALHLSSFDAVRVLKGDKPAGKGNFNLRRILVVTQFAISISLIVGTIVVSRQMNYIQQAKLGLNKDHVIMVNDVGYLSRPERQALKNSLLQIPGVRRVATSDGIVGGQNWTNGLRAKGSENSQLVNFLNVDHDFLSVLNIELKEGRGFSPQFPGDTADAIILNETAVKHLNVPSPAVGQQIVWAEDEDTTVYATVIGVVKDFHFASLKNEIKPFAFVTDNNRQWYFAIKLVGSNINHTIEQINSVWDKHVQSRPFQYTFLDDTYDKLYRAEANFKKIFLYITIIGIFIACLGLFGLSSFITEQRTKEIGIRKVLGASVSGILQMLSKDFVKLVLIASIIAFPLAWWAMNRWLQDFVYRINIEWWVFAASAVIAVAIALVTISAQAMKAALSNPVKSLRNE